MNCKICNSTDFVYTEEIGKAQIKTQSKENKKNLLKNSITVTIFTIITRLAVQFIADILSFNAETFLKIVDLIILGLIVNDIIVFILTIDRKKPKLWYKESRTKATCTTCWQQYYINDDNKELIVGIVAHNEPDPIEKLKKLKVEKLKVKKVKEKKHKKIESKLILDLDEQNYTENIKLELEKPINTDDQKKKKLDLNMNTYKNNSEYLNLQIDTQAEIEVKKDDIDMVQVENVEVEIKRGSNNKNNKKGKNNKHKNIKINSNNLSEEKKETDKN